MSRITLGVVCIAVAAVGIAWAYGFRVTHTSATRPTTSTTTTTAATSQPEPVWPVLEDLVSEPGPGTLNVAVRITRLSNDLNRHSTGSTCTLWPRNSTLSDADLALWRGRLDELHDILAFVSGPMAPPLPANTYDDLATWYGRFLGVSARIALTSASLGLPGSDTTTPILQKSELCGELTAHAEQLSSEFDVFADEFVHRARRS